MQCSARKFLASQALYGAQIAHPDWTHDQLVEEAVQLSALLIQTLDKPTHKRTNGHARPLSLSLGERAGVRASLRNHNSSIH